MVFNPGEGTASVFYYYGGYHNHEKGASLLGEFVLIRFSDMLGVDKEFRGGHSFKISHQ